VRGEGGIEKSIVKTSRTKAWTIFNLFYLRNIVHILYVTKQIRHGHKAGVLYVRNLLLSLPPPLNAVKCGENLHE
jgi:hypothetical protein